MKKIACVLPPWFGPLAQAIGQSGMESYHLWPKDAGQEFAHLDSVAGIDLQKAIRATGADELVTAQFKRLAANLSHSVTLFEGIIQYQPDAILVSYTADVAGRTAVAAARHLGVPLIHLEHAASSLDPLDAPFLRETPGDIVLVGGERDKDWWHTCAPDTEVRITGLPQFDWTAGFQPRERPLVPTILYVCEAGTNPEQSPRVWQFRDVPESTWRAFLSAMQRVDRPVKVLLKARAGEPPELCDRWLNDAKTLGLDVSLTDAHMSLALRDVDYVVMQQSNAGVESLLCGIPVIANVTRPGVTMLEDEVPSASGLAADLDERLLELIRDALGGNVMTPTRCREIASRYHVNDGRALERVCAVVREVAERKTAVARELVLT